MIKQMKTNQARFYDTVYTVQDRQENAPIINQPKKKNQRIRMSSCYSMMESIGHTCQSVLTC